MSQEQPDAERPAFITTTDLNQRLRAVLARVERGERLIVCRHRRPVATLQPLDGVVVQPFTGGAHDVFGWPCGGALEEAAKLSPCARELVKTSNSLLQMVVTHVWHFSHDEIGAAREELMLRGLVRRGEIGGTWMTPRGLALKEALTGTHIRGDAPR